MAIIGCGLIGGSIGLALKKNGLAEIVVGVGRNEIRLLKAKQIGAVDDATTDLEEGVRGVDLIIMATPVKIILEMVPKFRSYLKEGCIITDAGSTKAEIVHALTSAPEGNVHFVGAHPMAGSEASGVEASSPHLFEGATCVLTPIDRTNKEALALVRLMWEGVGARVIEMDPSKHDFIVGVTSHLPHVAAWALAHLASEHHREEEILPLLIAGGFRDTTRIAGSSPVLWRDICLTNKETMVDLLDKLKGSLDHFKDLISGEKEEELLEELKKIKEWRDKI